ncbi:MAG: TerB family tellurite resistance protein [Gammaproteobacteria bacterium]|uniref:tellurite resistance TerB family protein n=1 Tax=Pseudomaricurvus alcaniphilus TaxID=1166482 RepID=UPI001408D46A|nr:TerB family tellurite resistance protein [Pseudomaricurvus alcaniphilus]MBR9912405.1 TerB family tellurite resistance protein [Gammaproteobacteria bacterium]NHN36762.1 TerB family tellurite resistance protein [Pseudomaricurvus alcaniphilus]
MLQGFKALLSELLPQTEPPADPDALRQLAAAALMIEVATIDEHFDAQELATLKAELQRQFAVDGQALDDMIALARSESRDATSLYQFTRCINDEFSNQEKLNLMTGMWRIAYADGQLDKYEEHLIRRIADLIHLPHSQFIRAKQLARPD